MTKQRFNTGDIIAPAGANSQHYQFSGIYLMVMDITSGRLGNYEYTDYTIMDMETGSLHEIGANYIDADYYVVA